jgi:hypothetical protein
VGNDIQARTIDAYHWWSDHDRQPDEGEMSVERYADTVNEALDRLAVYGPEWGPGFAFHAPMVAEALASLGYYDQVPEWIESNRRIRRYSPMPGPQRSLDRSDPADLDAARGDGARFADWVGLFDRELAERPWREVLRSWWPRLLPGLCGALGHGMIRTAHAARVLNTVTEPTAAQRHELAQGLAFWAARYWSPAPPGPDSPLAAAAALNPTPHEARARLLEATATAAGVLADRAPIPTIPLVHMVTIPAAVDLLLPVLPVELHPDSYRFAVQASAAVLRSFSAHLQPADRQAGGGEPPPLGQSVAEAVETGDEHAIKLVEVCVRSSAAHPDNEPYRRAVAMVIHRLAHGQAVPRF